MNFRHVIPQLCLYGMLLKQALGIPVDITCVAFNEQFACVFPAALLETLYTRRKATLAEPGRFREEPWVKFFQEGIFSASTGDLAALRAKFHLLRSPMGFQSYIKSNPPAHDSTAPSVHLATTADLPAELTEDTRLFYDYILKSEQERGRRLYYFGVSNLDLKNFLTATIGSDYIAQNSERGHSGRRTAQKILSSCLNSLLDSHLVVKVPVGNYEKGSPYYSENYFTVPYFAAHFLNPYDKSFLPYYPNEGTLEVLNYISLHEGVLNSHLAAHFQNEKIFKECTKLNAAGLVYVDEDPALFTVCKKRYYSVLYLTFKSLVDARNWAALGDLCAKLGDRKTYMMENYVHELIRLAKIITLGQLSQAIPAALWVYLPDLPHVLTTLQKAHKISFDTLASPNSPIYDLFDAGIARVFSDPRTTR